MPAIQITFFTEPFRTVRVLGLGIFVSVIVLLGAGVYAADDIPEGLEIRAKGEYFEAPDVAAKHTPLEGIRFRFQNLHHRAPWCLFFVMLEEPVDLTKGDLKLSFGQVSDDLKVKLEVRDSRFVRWYNAEKRVDLAAGDGQQVLVERAGVFDALRPREWGRRVLWPDWTQVQYIGVVVEARYNAASEGELELNGIEYVTSDGDTKPKQIWADRVFCDEYSPAMLKRRWAQNSKADQNKPEVVRRRQEAERLEVTVEIKRDDPSSALFLSGQGYKVDFFSPVGVAGQGRIEQETHSIDGLLLATTRQLRFPERPPGVRDSDIREAVLSEPVDIRAWLGQVIFDPVEGEYAGWPRFTFTYEDVDVESDSSIVLDFRQQIHEFSLLWSTPYLDDNRRWRITLEPAYQFWKVTSGSDDFARLDKHRGLMRATLRDEWEQREFFLLGYYGKSNHKDADADEREYQLLAELRQWYGAEQFAFSTLGLKYTETKLEIGDGSIGALDTRGPRDDFLREFEVYGSYITELDIHGQWRWVGKASFNRTSADILIFFPTGDRDNVAFDFWEFESRIVNEVIPDVDVSLGVEHAVADQHSYDSMALEWRVSFFNAGQVRGEVGARHTWYYNVNDDLSSLFFRLDFAR